MYTRSCADPAFLFLETQFAVRQINVFLSLKSICRKGSSCSSLSSSFFSVLITGANFWKEFGAIVRLCGATQECIRQ
ncbi:ORF1216 [White spot syndrome virus]|uniref:ORF1216 n=1 Tax=White spot syndrome virus TaxID=342409 RepID=A0A2D3I678_9VIRU|nr:ORF1216 [White spot syndrome virus]